MAREGAGTSRWRSLIGTPSQRVTATIISANQVCVRRLCPIGRRARQSRENSMKRKDPARNDPRSEVSRRKFLAGADFMVDVIKTLDIKYLPSNPASSVRAIHESLIDYGGNKMPEFLTCTH